ncbi:minor tail protein [Mycobacterium phage Achebe]|uniref:Minor tail protein n=1 Tax=Mycobacterium phage Backyardigan TaxID=2902881 RepID=G1BL02_9CAUD|nr:minor tail protein [Mycobacterium phage Wile]YP_009635442.1 minor tail protein [Mycobacterium phage Backyardigan]AOT27537.1 minor tail protein [Mycobacterium phage Badger]APD17378.1 minor tail protein [Mycobacterium phage Achebe]ASZ73662.1 minor tail protein [Mycobacterium phage Morpher26]AZS11641.1 minor tail protein [Mycobacterium phage Cici]QAY05359.1 minor tail protein [Mycobacterium phage Katalie136]QAY06938.1 minor tail protein [Mycobacterium phage Datway]QBP31237.1 minor tail prot
MTFRYVPAYGLRVIQLAVLFEAIVRGLMYLFMPAGSSASLTQLENSAPLTVWGAVFITAAVFGLFGETLMSGTESYMGSSSHNNPRAWPSFIAHASLMILYVALAFGYGTALYQADAAHFAIIPYDLLLIAYLHWLFARRRKSHVS